MFQGDDSLALPIELFHHEAGRVQVFRNEVLFEALLLERSLFGCDPLARSRDGGEELGDKTTGLRLTHGGTLKTATHMRGTADVEQRRV